MKGNHEHAAKRSFLQRHRFIHTTLTILIIVVVLAITAVMIVKIQTDRLQAKLTPFYTTADLPPDGAPGDVVRQEPLDSKVPGGHGIRILYRTQRGDGSDTFSSGVVYVPDHMAAGKPVVAWAHGTLGLGDQCSPSRTSDPPSTMPGLAEMMQNGWVVTASDYAGFGTPGIQGYLVGGDEARDVLNSVRAARSLTGASSTLAIWGHSQGGNSALFTANDAASYAPELHLVGTVASAPAAELIPLLNEQYGTVADWVIGPLVATSWPAANSALSASDIVTPLGLRTYPSIADQCILPATLQGLARTALGQTFFSRNPVDVPTWHAMAQLQSAPQLPASQQLMVVESKADQVVLPNTTALYIKQACSLGINPTTLWLDKTSHQDIPKVSATQVISWMGDRLAGKAASSSCNQPLPVAPYTGPGAYFSGGASQ